MADSKTCDFNGRPGAERYHVIIREDDALGGVDGELVCEWEPDLSENGLKRLRDEIEAVIYRQRNRQTLKAAKEAEAKDLQT